VHDGDEAPGAPSPTEDRLRQVVRALSGNLDDHGTDLAPGEPVRGGYEPLWVQWALAGMVFRV
jgi:hypothetical protein